MFMILATMQDKLSRKSVRVLYVKRKFDVHDYFCHHAYHWFYLLIAKNKCHFICLFNITKSIPRILTYLAAIKYIALFVGVLIPSPKENIQGMKSSLTLSCHNLSSYQRLRLDLDWLRLKNVPANWQPGVPPRSIRIWRSLRNEM